MSLSLAYVFLLAIAPSWAYFADWSMMGSRPHEPTCVDIPKNMSLCSSIGYEKMRLPNLLDHDSLTEVLQQSGSWVPLLNVKCHPHTKLFLCSLFTPVCLESQIFPCRSLCLSVQKSCESRMKTYGYHWPAMLNCDKFPEDNDMCIKPPDKTTELEAGCRDCQPAETFENIIDNYCRAGIVLRARVKKHKSGKVTLHRSKVLKSVDKDKSGKMTLRRSKVLKSVDASKKKTLKFHLDNKDQTCCSFKSGKRKYLIMADHVGQKGVVSPTFVLPWKKSKSLKKAVRLFKTWNCTDPTNLFMTDDGTVVSEINGGQLLTKKERKKLRRGKKRRERKNRRKGKKINSDVKEKKKNKRRRKKNKKHRNNKTKSDVESITN